MINPEFLELLRKYGEVRIEYEPPITNSHVGDWDEAVIFQVYKDGNVVGNSGAYVLMGLNATLQDDSLDQLAARLVESEVQRTKYLKKLEEEQRASEEEWEVDGTWLSE